MFFYIWPEQVLIQAQLLNGIGCVLKGRALSHREHRLACIFYQWDGLLHQFSGMARFDLNAEWVSRKLVSAQFNPTYEHTTLTDGVEEGHEEGAHGSVISLFFLFFF